MQQLDTDAQPAIYAEWLQAGSHMPTVLVYAHYDVQPASIADGWATEPFNARIINDTFVGRGVSDCKGGLLQPLIAAEALLRTDGTIPVNLKFIFEGQEEIGSPQLEGEIYAAVLPF